MPLAGEGLEGHTRGRFAGARSSEMKIWGPQAPRVVARRIGHHQERAWPHLQPAIAWHCYQCCIGPRPTVIVVYCLASIQRNTGNNTRLLQATNVARLSLGDALFFLQQLWGPGAPRFSFHLTLHWQIYLACGPPALLLLMAQLCLGFFLSDIINSNNIPWVWDPLILVFIRYLEFSGNHLCTVDSHTRASYLPNNDHAPSPWPPHPHCQHGRCWKAPRLSTSHFASQWKSDFYTTLICE